MTRKGLTGLSVLVIVLMMVSVTVPAVSAVEENSTGIDFNRYAIPELNIDPSIETITISGALSPQQERGITESWTYGIPLGSIIVHTTEGITQVFDSYGDQLLSISDDGSGKAPTPASIEKACTYVHQLPNDSRVYHHEGKIYVLDSAGELLLLVIDGHASSYQKEVALLWVGNDWIESAEDYLNYITEYQAYWTVPSSPPSLESSEQIYLFNGILGVGGSKTYLLQPVLGYNGSTQQWQGQAWACDTTDPADSFVGPMFTSASGHTMRGRIYWSSSLQLWSITIYDQTSGQYSSLSTNCMLPQNNCLTSCVLEGWNVDDNTDVPGDTLFYDMSYLSYGTPMSVDLESWYSPYIPYVIMQYCWVDIIQDPSRVRLNTYN
ncbi:MAG: hypothetical protein QMC96_12715 [Methanomicrobiales archaeon]|nr:hypothetical protein [Methanomicrobiales archaeon]